MNVLVTGAGGMVGSHMVELLYERGDEVIGIWHKNKKNIEQITLPIRFVQCDLRYGYGIEELIMDNLPDQIFHLAAQSYPTVSWVSPAETIDVNINGTVAVFEAVKKARKYRKANYDPIVVVACSSAEYGQTLNELENPFVKETAELKPLHPYGVSKVGQDLLSFQYFMNDHIRCIRARIFNSTGTRKVNDVTSDFTKRAIEAEKTGIYELRCGNLETRRAIMDQRDLVHALLLLADKGRAGDVYNISSEHIYQMEDIVQMIEKQIGQELKRNVDPILVRPTDERIIVGNVDKIKADTGWKQDITMEQTIADMLEYWRNKGGGIGMALNRMNFMNTYVDNVTEAEAIKHIEECIRDKKVGHVITPNVDQIVRIEKDLYFKEICDNAELLLVDGHPLLWIAKWYGKPIKEKICGSDLVPHLCKIAAEKGYRVFLLGAAEGVAARAAKILEKNYPGIMIAGTYSPPLGFEKNETELQKINEILRDSNADLLFVGMGVPKQDQFIYENMQKYEIPMSFSIGATIDFIAGEQKRAPRWMTDHGMEWAYRLFCDPKRMFKRYIIDDMKIFRLAWKYRKVREG